MLTLEDLKPNATVTGLETGQVVRIVTTEAVGPDAVTVPPASCPAKCQKEQATDVLKRE